MADVDRWLQSRDSATQRSNASLAATTQADAAEVQGLEHAKARPRPKSRLVSYLNTYRNAEKTETASFEWSGLPVKDRIYVPRPNHMGAAILQQIMAHPMHDLPAGYNNLALRMIEDHRHLTAENHEQSQKLQAEIESHLENNEQYRRTLQSYDYERILPNASPPRHNATSGRKSSSGIPDHSPLLSIDNSTSIGSMRECPVRRHNSPSRSMTLISHAILTAESTRETKWTAGLAILLKLVAGPNIALVSCLTVRLANRLDCSPMCLAHEIAEAYRETLEQIVSDAPISVRSDLKPNTTPHASRNECDRNVRHINYKNLSHPTLAGSEMAKDSGHRWSFLFQPGDDAKKPSLSKATAGPGKAESVRHRMPSRDDNAFHQGRKAERSSDQASEAASLDTSFYQHTGISAAKSSLMSRTHRENLSRSVATAIKDSSDRSSSSPLEVSPRLYQATARGSLGGSEKNLFAIAAARAAGFREISDTKAGHGGEVAES